jgi:hypothetical protein
MKTEIGYVHRQNGDGTFDSICLRCPSCFSEALRPSRLRLGDARLLLTLRYPVRCRDCRVRAYAFVWRLVALRSTCQRLGTGKEKGHHAQ